MRKNGWSPDDDATLAKIYPELGSACQPIYFPQRSRKAVAKRAEYLGLAKKVPQRANTPKPRRIRFGEPIKTRHQGKRTSKSSFGYMGGVKVSSVFQLGSLT